MLPILLDSSSHSAMMAEKNATTLRIFSALPADAPATVIASAPTPFPHSLGGILGAVIFVQCASILITHIFYHAPIRLSIDFRNI